MKVKDLIKLLNKYDSELELCFINEESVRDFVHQPLPEVKKQNFLVCNETNEIIYSSIDFAIKDLQTRHYGSVKNPTFRRIGCVTISI